MVSLILFLINSKLANTINYNTIHLDLCVRAESSTSSDLVRIYTSDFGLSYVLSYSSVPSEKEVETAEFELRTSLAVVRCASSRPQRIPNYVKFFFSEICSANQNLRADNLLLFLQNIE